jgi:hypothetical protein
MALALAWQATVSDLQGGEHAVFNGHFNRDGHIAEEALEPEPGWPIVRGIDISAGYVSLVWFQLSRDGKRLSVLYEQQAPLSDGIEDAKRAAVQASQLLFPRWHFLDVVSAPSWAKRSDEQRAPADLFRPESMPQKSEAAMPVRLQAVQQWLGRQVGGEESALLIDPGCMQLALAFGGAYAWRQSGGRVMPGVVTNAAASLMDAFSFALTRVTPTGQLDARLRRDLMGPIDFGPPP